MDTYRGLWNISKDISNFGEETFNKAKNFTSDAVDSIKQIDINTDDIKRFGEETYFKAKNTTTYFLETKHKDWHYILEYIQEHPYEIVGITVGIILLCLILWKCFYCLIHCIGFGGGGVVKGSCAACCHSSIGNVPKGSCFSCFQSCGARS